MQVCLLILVVAGDEPKGSQILVHRFPSLAAIQRSRFNRVHPDPVWFLVLEPRLASLALDSMNGCICSL